jgi:hypothetical protein
MVAEQPVREREGQMTTRKAQPTAERLIPRLVELRHQSVTLERARAGATQEMNTDARTATGKPGRP